MEQASTSFNRWYDADVYVSEMVQSVEKMSADSQQLFGYLLCFFSDAVIQAKDKSKFIRELDWDHFKGLIKSKRKRRWYDREPILHKAFNLLYALTEEDKMLVAKELSIPSQIVRDYERDCLAKNKEPNLDVVYKIVETVFTEGTNKARQSYQQFEA